MNNTAQVAISNYHENQMVQPSVQAHRVGRKFHVTLSWYDKVDQSYSQSERFSGDVFAVEDWLRAKGVHLDAQGVR